MPLKAEREAVLVKRMRVLEARRRQLEDELRSVNAKRAAIVLELHSIDPGASIKTHVPLRPRPR